MFRTTVIDQISIATEVANPEEKNADHLLPPPSMDLLSTTNSKDVRFPWVTLYILIIKANKMHYFSGLFVPS